MLVRIMSNHPIATRSPPECYDGKTHDCDVNPLDVHALGAWLTKRVGFKFDYHPTASRLEGTRCVFFPARRRTGLHAMWIEPVTND